MNMLLHPGQHYQLIISGWWVVFSTIAFVVGGMAVNTVLQFRQGIAWQWRQEAEEYRYRKAQKRIQQMRADLEYVGEREA